MPIWKKSCSSVCSKGSAKQKKIKYTAANNIWCFFTVKILLMSSRNICCWCWLPCHAWDRFNLSNGPKNEKLFYTKRIKDILHSILHTINAFYLLIQSAYRSPQNWATFSYFILFGAKEHQNQHHYNEVIIYKLF